MDCGYHIGAYDRGGVFTVRKKEKEDADGGRQQRSVSGFGNRFDIIMPSQGPTGKPGSSFVMFTRCHREVFSRVFCVTNKGPAYKFLDNIIILY